MLREALKSFGIEFLDCEYGCVAFKEIKNAKTPHAKLEFWYLDPLVKGDVAKEMLFSLLSNELLGRGMQYLVVQIDLLADNVTEKLIEYLSLGFQWNNAEPSKINLVRQV